jgi:hypothetical protein
MNARWGDGLRRCSPRCSEGDSGRSFLNERGQAGQLVGVSNTIMKIVEHIDLQFLGGFHQRLKGIPSSNALSGACLQAHVSFADALSGPELGGIVVQENFGMGKHDQQRFFLGQRQYFALIQLLVAAGLPKELVKGHSQRISLGDAGMVSVSQQVSVEFPKVLGELLEKLAMGQETRDKFLVMAIFVDPAPTNCATR